MHYFHNPSSASGAFVRIPHRGSIPWLCRGTLKLKNFNNFNTKDNEEDFGLKDKDKDGACAIISHDTYAIRSQLPRVAMCLVNCVWVVTVTMLCSFFLSFFL